MTEARFKPDLQAFVDAAPHLMLALDPEFTIVAANAALLRSTHKKREDVVGHNVFAVFPDNPGNEHAVGEAHLRASLERVLATKRNDKMPVQRYDVRDPAHGVYECRYWNPTNYPVLDDSGEVAYIIHQSEEVTELIALRERAEDRDAALAEAHSREAERLRAQAERERLVAESETQRRIYEAALSNTPDLVYVFDLEHRFIYANEALLTMWGRTREEALGRNCLELGYEQWHAEMHDREIEQVVATRAPIRGEVPFTGTHGRRIYDYIFVPVIGADGDVVAVAGTTRDVTERKQAEQSIREQADRLREADRAKDEFLATLAHELRNPLAPIANSLEILKRASDNADIAAKARETLERQLKHLVRLVDDLLDVSRITRGRMELRKGPVELSAIIEQALEACRTHIDNRRHSLTVVVPEVPIRLDADAVRLVQVFSNLINNAAKYTAPGGSVAVRAEQRGSDVVIGITDSGIGIAPDMLGRVFDMFIRADQSLERSQDGLGIGLTLARRLVELHGGTISAKSDGLGLGSEFTVRLPLPQTPSSTPQCRSSSSAASP